MSDPSQDILSLLYQNEARLGKTEVKEVPVSTKGTFTPTLVGSTIAGTFTYDAANTGATYTRIGNRVFISGRVRITAIAVAPTGNLAIGGLPLTPATTGQNIAGGAAVLSYTGITLTGGRTQLHGIVTDGNATLILFESGSNLATAVVQGGGLVLVGGVGDLRFEGQYQV